MTTTLDYLGTVPHSLELHTEPRKVPKTLCVANVRGGVDAAGDTSKGALKVKCN